MKTRNLMVVKASLVKTKKTTILLLQQSWSVHKYLYSKRKLAGSGEKENHMFAQKNWFGYLQRGWESGRAATINWPSSDSKLASS